MTAADLVASPTSTRRGVIAVIVSNVALVGLLLVGALYPQGNFEGKGMAYRLPAFVAPSAIVSWRWWRRVRRGERPPYPVALDLALTLPFLSDTIGNALGLFDNVRHFDSVMHTVNWALLCGGITLAVGRTRRARGIDAVLLTLVGGGIGALAIIAWEIMEYFVMKSGVGGLDLTYADTLGDLFLSGAGGVIGAWWAARRLSSAAQSTPA